MESNALLENHFIMYEPGYKSESESEIESATDKTRDQREISSSNNTPTWEYRKMNTQTESVRSQFYAHYHLVAILCISGAILLIAAGYALYRQKKRRRSLYQPFLGFQTTVPKISKPADPIVYNYVCAQKPVDFVVPSAPPTTVPSPVDPTAAPPTSIESGGALCRKLSLLEAGPTLLGGLNPDLYKSTPEEELGENDFPEGHIGRLWFAIEHDANTERLIVRLLKVRNIPSRVYGAANCCDPFVRIYLMPDERRYQQSRPKKKTCNPKFDETFLFQLPGRSTEERTLKFTVFDNDRGKHHNPIGHVQISLKEFFQSEQHSEIQWRDLEKNEVPSDLGEMMISLCYNQTLERLIVTVCEARRLRMPEGFKTLDSVCRLVFMRENKVAKTKKTAVCKNSLDPKYNESFHFRLPKSAVNLCSVTLQIMQAGTKEKDRFVGRVILGPYMFSKGKGREHWDEAMSAGHKQIRYWHKLS